MTDDEHEKTFVPGAPDAKPAAERTDKLLIRRDKLDAAPDRHAIDRPQLAAPAERHRAWLRRVARRER
jgi:hypothetical protein